MNGSGVMVSVGRDDAAEAGRRGGAVLGSGEKERSGGVGWWREEVAAVDGETEQMGESVWKEDGSGVAGERVAARAGEVR